MKQASKTIPQRLVRKILQLQQLNTHLKYALPEEIARHAEIINVDKQTLIIATDNVAWNNRIRMFTPHLLNYYQQEHQLDILTVKIKTAREHFKKTKAKPEQRKTLSEKSQSSLRSLAEDTEDGELKNALNNLLKHQSN